MPLHGQQPIPWYSTPADRNAFDLRKSLAAAAQGGTPSAAENQLAMAQARSAQMASALANSQAGISPGARLRMAMQGAADANSQAGLQAAMLRAQEMAQARGQYADYLTQGRAMDLQKRAADQQFYGSLLGGVAAGGALALSDEREKTAIGGGNDDAETLLDALRAYTYEYKDPSAPGAAPGGQLGVMAQDAERGGPMGEAMVADGPGGKMIDQRQALSSILAMLANLHHRMRGVEGR